MHSKCQHLSPTQWANVHSEAECEQACIDRGGALHTIPVGYGTRSQRRQTNRLRPPPPKASRLRRKAASTKAAGSTSSGAEDSHGGWDGHAWVHQSVLTAVEAGDEQARALKHRHPCLSVLGKLLRAYLWPGHIASALPKLPHATAASISVRPGIMMRDKDADPNINRRVQHARCGESTEFTCPRPCVHARACCFAQHGYCELLWRGGRHATLCRTRARGSKLQVLFWRAEARLHLHSCG